MDPSTKIPILKHPRVLELRGIRNPKLKIQKVQTPTVTRHGLDFPLDCIKEEEIAGSPERCMVREPGEEEEEETNSAEETSPYVENNIHVNDLFFEAILSDRENLIKENIALAEEIGRLRARIREMEERGRILSDQQSDWFHQRSEGLVLTLRHAGIM